jgi:hypothetical protein
MGGSRVTSTPAPTALEGTGMITKTPAKRGATTKVTFEVPAESAGERVCLCGDFNSWLPDATPLTRRKDGRFSGTLNLEQGRSYRFRYLIDGERWENDPNADEYVDNGFGSKDSVIHT